MARQDQGILIENSGYHLRNFGDVAMLKAAVKRIRAVDSQIPIRIICSDSSRLEKLIPGTHSISNSLPHQAQLFRHFPLPYRIFPSKIRGRLFKQDLRKNILYPWLLARKLKRSKQSLHQEWLRLLSDSVAVIATGGGYLTERFEHHATGLLTTMVLAQALGKPTAFFGQGIGPISTPDFRQLVTAALKHAAVVALREPILGTHYLKESNIHTSDWCPVTGDDALELMPFHAPSAESTLIGLTLRLTSYSGVSQTMIPFLRQQLQSVLTDHPEFTAFCPLPLDLVNEHDNDESNAFDVLEGCSIYSDYSRPSQPEDIIELARQCRITITGSYHSALFSIAQGVPVVAIDSNDYYSAKFAGLEALFPGSITAFKPLNAETTSLSACVAQAVRISGNQRNQWVETAATLNTKARSVYRRFFSDSVYGSSQ